MKIDRAAVVLRIGSPEARDLARLLCRRYPGEEWAAFLRFGWRESAQGLVLTLAEIDSPHDGDLDESVGHVAIQEPYSLRIALAAERHPLAVGVIHSHPKGCLPQPSPIDDDMDRYYAEYFASFAPDRPYVSLILSEIRGELTVSGRVAWRGAWRAVTRLALELTMASVWPSVASRQPTASRGRLARLASAFGDLAAERLRKARVAVIGAGGTGSAAIEVLARAGVGELILVDPDSVEESNLERIHGSRPADAKKGIPKVTVARRHVREIDPSIRVQALIGSLPQQEVLHAVSTADVALGCTDQQHSRLALSDLAIRYLVPALDCGVALEGQDGSVTAQVGQLVRFSTVDPCALCRQMVTPQRIAQELMSGTERDQRRAAAREAEVKGDKGDAYWRELPQLNTVGYLTTGIGAFAAGYVIGWVTGRFTPPFARLQMNMVARDLDVTNVEERPRPDCSCQRGRGKADQGAADALITAPPHWPAVRIG